MAYMKKIGPDGHGFDDSARTVELRKPTQILKCAELSPVITVIQGPHCGKMFLLQNAAQYLGRSDDVDIVLKDDGISRKHLRLFVNAEHNGVEFEDCGSTNGVFMNGVRAKRGTLKSGDRIRLGANTLLQFSWRDDTDINFQNYMYNASVRDPLTGAYNRRYFDDILVSEFAHAERYALPLSLILLDLDYFKKINDTHGHPFGDMALQQVVTISHKALRTEDLFFRSGGEEFAVVLRATPQHAARRVAERMRRLIAVYGFKHDAREAKLTVSLGVATAMQGRFRSANELVHSADTLLYTAKSRGRDIVVSEHDRDLRSQAV